jgi:hypothetical protein
MPPRGCRRFDVNLQFCNITCRYWQEQIGTSRCIGGCGAHGGGRCPPYGHTMVGGAHPTWDLRLLCLPFFYSVFQLAWGEGQVGVQALFEQVGLFPYGVQFLDVRLVFGIALKDVLHAFVE